MHNYSHEDVIGRYHVFLCPVCGREIWVSFPPNYIKIVKVAGNEAVVHKGGFGGLDILSSEVRQSND